MIHINIVNSELKKFLFDSRKIVLKNPINGYCYRCYTKYLNYLYQYFTMVPNSSNGEKPIDFLTIYDGKQVSANLLLGSYMIEMPIDEYNKIYNEIERLVELSFYFDVPIDKVEEIIKYYSLKIFSERTKEKILMLQDKFIDNLTDDTISKFEYMYYQYYHSVENERKQRLQCMLLGEGKTYIK